MKRLLLIVTLFFLFLIPAGKVSAGLATHAKGSIGGADAFKMITGHFAGFSIFGKVFPIVISTNENNVPDLQPFSIFGNRASPWAQPRAMQENSQHYTSDNFRSGKYCAKLVVKPPWGDKVVGFDLTEDTTEVSVNYPFSQPYAETGQKISSLWGFMRTVPTTGQYNYNWPTHVVSTISTFDCYMADAGVPDQQNIIGVTNLAEFPEAEVKSQYNGPTLTEEITKLIDGVWQTITQFVTEAVPMILEVTIKQRDGSVTSAHCFWGRCNPGHAEGDDLVKMAKVKGNFTAVLAPNKDVQKPVDVDATEDQQIQIQSGVPFSKKDTMDLAAVYYNRAAAKTDTTSFLCYAAPKNKQDVLVVGDKDSNLPLNCAPTQPAVCSAGPPNLSGSSSCKQCSPDMKGWAEGDSVPGNKLPAKLIKLVETVGDKIGVPPASILTAMYHEGAFVATQLDTGSYQAGPFVGSDQWTDANVVKWSTCGQTMPNCPLKGNTFKDCGNGNGSGQCGKAIVGTGQIPKWFWGNGGESDPWAAAKKVDPTRDINTISPCNLLDSIAATAQELKAYGSVSRTPPACFCKDGSSNYGSCGKFAMTSTSSSSCSPSSWNDDKIVQSHTGLWVGNLPFCPDGSMPPTSEFGNNTPDPTYGQRVLGQYKHFSCQSGY